MKIMRAALALATVALVLGPFAVTGSAQVGCPGVTQNGSWTSIVGPSYESGTRGIDAYAVDPVAPSTIYVTNGKAVQRTIDGGCSWEQRFALDALPQLPISVANSNIVQIEIPESPFAQNTIHLLVEEQVGPVARPHVIVSRDGGSTWAPSDNGLPPATGNVLGLHVAPDSPEFLYLHAMLPTGNDEIYASVNGGRNWERRTGPTGGIANYALAVDPQDSNELWTWGGAGLHHSVDGGRSRSYINRVAPEVSVVDVFHAAGAPSRIIANEPETASFKVSQDGGRTWFPISGPIVGSTLSITHGNTAADVVVSLHEGIYRLMEGGLWRDISPEGTDRDILDLSADRTSTPSIFGRTASNSIEKYSALDADLNLDPLDITNPTIETGLSKLVPENVKLKLGQDQERKVRFQLDLPPQPNPVDVFFLVDTSKSMDSTIAGLRTGMQQIITELSGQGLDVQFGVGEIKDYPIPGYGDPQQGDFPYRLDTKITNDPAALNAALERLESSGGGALDQPESQLTGLYQAATGTGDPGFVPPDQDAGFRADALPVIVNITDAVFHKEAQHPSPPFETVANELRAQGILQIGLAVYGPNGSRGLTDLQEMASQTETVAPVGVDCDGNGTVDLPPGQPLVCEISDTDFDGSLNLAPAIIATIEAVTEEVHVALVPDGSEKATDLIDAVSPEILTAVDIKESNTLTFDVTFLCPNNMLGTTQNVKLQATVGSDVVAESTAKVVCKPLVLGKRPRREVPPLLLAVPAIALPIAIAAPPPPPPPIVEQFPASQSAAQAQGAMATEEQEQLQVAVAKQRSTFSSEREEVYEFSSYSERKGGSPAFLYLSAGAMAAAYASIVLARNRARLALQRKRR